jgi:hypothetical protein
MVQRFCNGVASRASLLQGRRLDWTECCWDRRRYCAWTLMWSPRQSLSDPKAWRITAAGSEALVGVVAPAGSKAQPRPW